ncbi:MAG: group II intron reverse transcriptase/maturase [Coriobacteriales bacterium]
MNGNDLRTDSAGLSDGLGLADQWELFDWEEAERHVSGLQSRIAEAESEGKRGKVRKLQRLLTNSHHAKMLAVKRVTSNKGKNTPGVDMVIWETPAQKMGAALSLTSKGYKAKPLRRVYIPKRNGKKRPLGIPTMYDRAMQALFTLALEPVAEVTGDRHSYGFRKGRSAQDACAQAFLVLSHKRDAEWVLEGDIKGCFDHISHEWLMEHIPMDKKVLRQFLKAGFMEEGIRHDTDEGTPQGGIISPILANMALDGIDRLLDDRYHNGRSGKRNSYKSRKSKVNLVRYADDFIVTAKTPEIAREVKALVADFLSERGLELSEEKTHVTRIDKGFDFLGWSFRKYSGKLIIKPSRKSVQAFVDEMHLTILRRCIAWDQDGLIRMLAPKIRGFANYHRSVCSSKTFSDIDNKVTVMLFRWVLRRHRKKTCAWRKKHCWCKLGNRDWIFGNPKHYLPLMSWQHIVRHPALSAGRNPFLDPEYFEERKSLLQKRFAHSFRRAHC